MSFIHGVATFSRYRVDGTLPGDYIDVFPKRILRYGFRNLDDLPGEERSAGWVRILDMFDPAFKAMEYFKDPYLALSWRVDTKKIPKEALTQYSRKEENEVKEREGIEYLAKSRREEIRDAVRSRLLKRALPQSGVYDMVWNLQTNAVLFGATSNKLCDEFAEFFRKTFDLFLIPVYPYALAQRAFELSGKDQDLADDVQPLFFEEGALR
jgi:DNA recombination-dependent growth factor C